MKIASRFGVESPFDPHLNHVTSPFFKPSVFAFIRLLIAVYTLITLLVSLIWDQVNYQDGQTFFSYFTHLSYIGICAYFFAAGVQTFAFARYARGRSQDAIVAYPLQSWPRSLQFLHVFIQTTVLTFPFVTTIIFWGLLASSDVFSSAESTWSNVSLHIFNLVFALFEIFFTNIPPPPPLMIPLCLVLLALYLGLAFITYATQGIYVYSFLNPPKGKHYRLIALVFGLLVGYIVLFFIVRIAMRLIRVRIFKRRQQQLNKSGNRDGDESGVAVVSEPLEEWEEVESPVHSDRDRDREGEV